MNKFFKYRLGIDMGIASIGWAIVQLNDQNEPVHLENMGVRKFNSGRDDITQAPLASDRRKKRSMRRQRARFVRRRTKLLNKLTCLGLMPADRAERKLVADCTHDQISELGLKATPYHLRAAGLKTHLPAYALGRVLFALNQRRGFKSNRKENKESASKSFYEGIESLQLAINELKARNDGNGSLGDYFAYRLDCNLPVLDSRDSKDPINLSRKGLQTTRSMYIEEFEALRKVQCNSPHHKLGKDDWDRLYEIIFQQRPLREMEKGRCQIYGPKGLDLERAYASDPLFQRMRVWQDINNLKFRLPDQSAYRFLSDGERHLLKSELYKRSSISFAKLRILLGLPAGTDFNLSSAKDEKLKGIESDVILSKEDLFGKKWLSFSDEEKSSIISLLERNMEDEDRIIELIEQWGVSEEQAERVVDARLESGTSRFSTRALSEIISLISTQCVDKENNRYMSTTEAVNHITGDNYFGEAREIPDNTRLPYYAKAMPEVGMHQKYRTSPDEKKYGIIGNPTVHIALNQLRHLVNAIIEKYGLPTSISVEVARDLKLSKKEKASLEKKNRQFKSYRDRMVEECAKSGVSVNKDSRDDSLKYRLWIELSSSPCDRKCPYTGETISINRLFSNDVHIEHILPRSRSLDDSPANLTLAMRDANKMKGNETPYEYFNRLEKSGADDGSAYQRLLHRVASFPPNKRWRFYQEAAEILKNEQGWLSSMLNDTKYMSRLAHKYLRTVCNDVQVSPGKLTSKARRQWIGDSEGLEKNRELDHRHHALDALTLCLINRSILQAAAQSASLDGPDNHAYLKLKLPCPMPKDTLRYRAKEIIDKMIVSHRIDHGAQSQRHEETAIAHKDKPVLNFKAHPQDATPLVLITHMQGNLKHTNFYKHSGVHHIDFWLIKLTDKKGQLKEKIKAVPVYYHEIENVMSPYKHTRPCPTAKFIMRLHKGDAFVLSKSDTPTQVRIVRHINPSKGNENLVHCSVNTPAEKDSGKLRFNSILSKGIAKVKIDILGNCLFNERTL